MTRSRAAAPPLFSRSLARWTSGTLLSLFARLGVTDHAVPRFGASVVFELHELDGGRFEVAMLYNPTCEGARFDAPRRVPLAPRAAGEARALDALARGRVPFEAFARAYELDALADAQHAFADLASRKVSARGFVERFARKVARRHAAGGEQSAPVFGSERQSSEQQGQLPGPDRVASGVASYTEA